MKKLFISLCLLLFCFSLCFSEVVLTDQEAEAMEQALMKSEMELILSQNKIAQLETSLEISENIQKMLLQELERQRIYLDRQKNGDLFQRLSDGFIGFSIGFTTGDLVSRYVD